jgi:hypothetical protein
MIETEPTLTKDEQTLVTILRTLPVERIAQVLDYARYIQFRAFDDIDLLDDETEEEILADEALWDAQFAATQDKMEALAEKLRAEIRAGRTQDMVFTDDGELAPE